MNTSTKLALTGGGLAAVVALTAVGTLALFTDQDTIPANTFSTGNISLTTSPTSALVTYANMLPGDTVTSALVVTNAGSAQLRYAVSSTATNVDTKGLRNQLVLTIKEGDTATPTTCTAFDGEQQYTGDLDSAGTYTGETPLVTGKLIGDVATGQTGGAAGTAGADRVLPPTALNVETLCFRVTLPSGTGNAFQTAATTATFTFDSEQTANNP